MAPGTAAQQASLSPTLSGVCSRSRPLGHGCHPAVSSPGATAQPLTGAMRAAASALCCDGCSPRSTAWPGVVTHRVRDPHARGEHRPAPPGNGGPRAWGVAWVGPWLGRSFLKPALSTPLQGRAGVHRFQGRFSHPQTSGHSTALARVGHVAEPCTSWTGKLSHGEAVTAAGAGAHRGCKPARVSRALGGRGGGPGLSKGRVPGPLLQPRPRTRPPSSRLRSRQHGRAGLLKPFLKRNQAAAARAIFRQLC